MFVGRSDRQVKIRGHRVELNEVENKILDLDEVEAVAVFTKMDEEGQHSICANIILKESNLTEEDVRKIISKSLAAQAVPTEIQFVTNIRRTSAGKVDYKNLTK